MRISSDFSKTLVGLQEGQSARLSSTTSMSPVLLRLMEMGMTPGTHVVLTRVGPGGCPLEIELRGTRLCLRRTEATCFVIDDADGGSAVPS